MDLGNKKIIFAQKLKQLRLSKNMTMSEFGKQIGFSKQTVSRLESGRAEPALYTVVKIADFFNCSLDDLVFGEIFVGTETHLKLKDFIADISEIEKTNLQAMEQIKSLKKFARDVSIMSDSKDKECSK